MKKSYLIFGAIAAVVLAVVFIFVVKPAMEDRTVATTAVMTIDRQDLDVAFTYPSGEDAYTLIEPPVPAGEDSPIQGVFLMMPTPQYIDYQNDKGSTPPSVSLFVLPQPEDDGGEGGRITRLQRWAESNSQFSSYAAITSEPEVVEVDGVKALRYFTAGTYNQEVYLVQYSGRIYVFTGQYEEEEDSIRGMFVNFMQEVTFY
mgnify:CR=1 FL=1|tara:strand:- start:2901 stop:3506 length:606 start_codon:yes stop_codon:yes gene_type:complete